jgi:phosphopantothenoylcysteine decarboxylase/phosphopantothenate--cysteine ligase
MGIALAEAAHARGARVTLIAANIYIDAPPAVERHDVVTAAELRVACEREFAGCDVLLMAAAVADFAPAAAHRGKLKKSGRERLELVLEPTPDVLAGLSAARRPGQTIVGFAAEHGPDAVALAREKLERKRLDAIVVNDVSRPGIGFEAPENEVTVLLAARNGSRPVAVPRSQKSRVADAILDAVGTLLVRG